MATQRNPLKVLVVGLGNMGRSHALAYHNNPGYEIVGLVNRTKILLPEELVDYPYFDEYHSALKTTEPDVVSVNTYTDTHADYAIAAMQQGAHVFVEKPLAATVEDAQRVVDFANSSGKKLVIGYILRHHPSWITLIDEARNLGGPYVFRLNLNQQSSGATWQTHKQLMESLSPIVDCGVHYLDVMCQITDGKPVTVRGMGVRLSDEIHSDMYNYGHLQVIFDDGSVGWYEAGWGPMMSETAFFVKDIVSPGGSVSIIMDSAAKSDDIDTHTQTSTIKIHRSETTGDEANTFVHPDSILNMQDEPGHQELCNREQAFMLEAIATDQDLSRHWADAIKSLQVCLAADESIRSGREISL
ncbi:MAG: Gfo/Idh/MocA family protein [Granulosicoccus sp.]